MANDDLGETDEAGLSVVPGSSRSGGARFETPPSRRGSHSHLRDLNVSLLIELARQFGPISRADLARQSQISAPTVSAIVAQLLERGILSELEVAPSSGGRPPILLQLNPNAGYVVGIKRGWDPTEWKVYPMSLREPLKTVPIPLRKRDGEVVLELQPIVDRAYVMGGHDDIDYSRPATPRLNRDDAAWAEELLKSAGRR